MLHWCNVIQALLLEYADQGVIMQAKTTALRHGENSEWFWTLEAAFITSLRAANSLKAYGEDFVFIYYEKLKFWLHNKDRPLSKAMSTAAALLIDSDIRIPWETADRKAVFCTYSKLADDSKADMKSEIDSLTGCNRRIKSFTVRSRSLRHLLCYLQKILKFAKIPFVFRLNWHFVTRPRYLQGYLQ